MSASLNRASLHQRYQALDRLQPLPHAPSKQQKAWSDAEAELQAAGPRSVPQQREAPQKLLTALLQLGLQYKASHTVKGYSVAVVIHPNTSTARPILLSVGKPDCFSNQPTRLTGRAGFRQQLLAQEGIVVTIPRGTVTAADARPLTDYLKARLQAAVEGNLDAYYVRQ